MDILRGNTVIATVHPTDDSVYSCKLMGDNAVKLNFKSSIAVSMLIGDTIVYNGATFTLNSQPIGKEVSSREYEYTCEFQAVDSELKKVEYRLFDNTPIPPQGEFSLMGTARTFVQLLVDNMNRIQSGWTLGQVLDTEFKSLDFSTENCLTVIQNIAKEFNTEFYITAPKVINLQQKPFTGAVIDLEYGINKGLKSLTKLKNDDSVLITSLHVLGGTRNLPLGYRDGSQRLMLPGGLPLQNNVDKFGVIEGTKVFDGIYPRLAAGDGNDPGKVTANAGLYQFTDTNLDFDVNQYLSDATAKVVFLTGELAGYQFEIASYVHATKTFTINPATYENSIELPSAYFHAAPGDKYVLIDIIMPQADVDRAEAELLAAATAYLPVCSNLTDNYTGDCDPLYFRRNNISIVIGQIVRIISAQLVINKEIRVIGINQNLNNPFIYKLDFGDIISGRLAALESDVAGIAKTSTSASKTLSQTDSLIVQLKNSSLRRYSDAKGVSKRINDFTQAASVLDTHRLEVDKVAGLESEYIEVSQLWNYIAAKLGVTVEATKTIWDRDFVTNGTIQFFGSGPSSGGGGGGGASALWQLTDVADDMEFSIYGDIPCYNGTHFSRYNISNLALSGHSHTIGQVDGLQGLLDGKQALLGYAPYYSANFVAGVNYSAPHTHPYLSDADARIANWNTAYNWGNHAGLYRPIGYVPSWAEVTSKPTWTDKLGWDGAAVTVSTDLHVIGKLVVDGTIQLFGASSGGTGGGGSTTLWGLSDVSDDVANAVNGDLIQYNGTHWARINQSVLAPAVHTHTIAQVNGLQGALDGKQSSGSYVLTSDSRLSDSRVASDVYAWAKTTTKPSYTYSEIGGILPPASDVYPWAKAATKPTYTKTEIGLSLADNTADSTKSVAYAANSSKLYSTDGVYGYGGGAAYYGYLTYNSAASRWRFKVSPATPADVEVAYSDNSGLLNGRNDYSLTNHGHNILYSKYTYNEGGGCIDNATLPETLCEPSNLTVAMQNAHSLFGTYATTLSFSGYQRYGAVQLSVAYNGGNGGHRMAFRNYWQTTNTWNSWCELWNSDNFNPSNYVLLSQINTLGNTSIPKWNGSALVSSTMQDNGTTVYFNNQTFFWNTPTFQTGINVNAVANVGGLRVGGDTQVAAGVGLEIYYSAGTKAVNIQNYHRGIDNLYHPINITAELLNIYCNTAISGNASVQNRLSVGTTDTLGGVTVGYKLGSVAYLRDTYQEANDIVFAVPTGAGYFSNIRWAGGGGAGEAFFGAVQAYGTTSGQLDFFWKTYNGSGYGERMRLTTTGQLQINAGNTTSPTLVLTANSITNSMGSLNASYWHFDTTAPSGYYFYKNLTCQSNIAALGNITASGNIIGLGTMQFYTASDRRLKTDFEAITNPLEKIKSLTGYFFNYTDQAMSLGGYTSRRDIGLIAQDVNQILPEACGKLWNTDFMGYKAEKLIPLFVEAIKQQQNQIDELKRQRA